MTLSTLPVAPEPTGPGAAACADPVIVPAWWRRSPDVRLQAAARAARPDFEDWLLHVKGAAACTRPVRLAGTIATIEAATGRLLAERSTADMPDGVIYKPCGNRRESVCPSCSKLYQRDAYQVVRAGLVGGKGVPERVAHHPAVFPTFTAPSFGEVHTRRVKRHTCARRKDCDCRPEPCHARRDLVTCPHGARLACFARHEAGDARLGTPLCLDCYDHDAHVVWNSMAGELWRRTTIAINRYLTRLCRQRGIPFHLVPYTSGGKIRYRKVPPFRLSFGKAAEMQRRAAVHLHAIVRLDGRDPDDEVAILPPPPGLDAADIKAAIDHAAATVAFTTDVHCAGPAGWRIGWGDQVHTKLITVAADGEVTDAQVAAYLAKYATKSTEITGHTSPRMTEELVTIYANAHGSHTQRLIEACWRLGDTGHADAASPGKLLPVRTSSTGGRLGPGRVCPACGARTRYRVCPGCSASAAETARLTAARQAATGPAKPSATDPRPRLRRWAHMLGFGGHFLTKSRRYSITFALLRNNRIVFRRAQNTGPEQADPGGGPTTLVVNFLQFVGAGWHTTADAMLANTSAAMAREHAEAARHHLTTLAA